MGDVAISVIGLFGTVLIAVLGLYGARKYNIGPNQEKLVNTLKDLVDAQGDRISQLELEAKERDQKLVLLSTEVTRLNNLTISQLLKIQELELQLEAERRGHG
jgi:hypothetical protein